MKDRAPEPTGYLLRQKESCAQRVNSLLESGKELISMKHPGMLTKGLGSPVGLTCLSKSGHSTGRGGSGQ